MNSNFSSVNQPSFSIPPPPIFGVKPDDQFNKSMVTLDDIFEDFFLPEKSAKSNKSMGLASARDDDDDDDDDADDDDSQDDQDSKKRKRSSRTLQRNMTEEQKVERRYFYTLLTLT
jgi:hypothetical protein